MPFPLTADAPLGSLLQLGDFLIEAWDAERADLITIATGVSAWAGIKLGLVLAQGTAANQPVRSASSFGGAAGVAFDGSNDELTLALAGQLPTGAVASELWCVAQSDQLIGVSTAGYIVAQGADANTSWRAIHRFVSGSTNRARAIVGDGAANSTPIAYGAAFSNRHAVRLQVSPTTTRMSIDGIAGGNGLVVPATGITRIRLGASPGAAAASFFLGQIALVIITHPLPTGLAAQLWSYLLTRRRL